MSRYSFLTLLIAIAVAASMVGIGISIAQKSILGGIACAILTVLFMGAGFAYKKKHHG